MANLCATCVKKELCSHSSDKLIIVNCPDYRKNGQEMPIDEYVEKQLRRLCKKCYRQGYRDGMRAKEKQLRPDKHYCKECKWWNGPMSSIGTQCTNPNRHRVSSSDTANYKYGSQIACKTGFEPKEADHGKKV